MDMSQTPEVPTVDELDRDRAERRAFTAAPRGHDRMFGTGSIEQRMRTVLGALAVLGAGNAFLALAMWLNVEGAPAWFVAALFALTAGLAAIAVAVACSSLEAEATLPTISPTVWSNLSVSRRSAARCSSRSVSRRARSSWNLCAAFLMVTSARAMSPISSSRCSFSTVTS